MFKSVVQLMLQLGTVVSVIAAIVDELAGNRPDATFQVVWAIFFLLLYEAIERTRKDDNNNG